MQEAGTEYTLVFLPNAFICAFHFPRYAATLTALFALSRLNLIKTYSDYRGYNGAMIHEELMRFELILMLGGAFASGLRMTRVMQPVAKALKPTWQKIKGVFKR